MNKISLNLWESKIPNFKRKIISNAIIDRKSKYTIVWWYVETKENVDDFMKEILKDRYFRKATHNTYAYRIKLENWSILEWKNDDWETWAWMCVLRELQRENAINTLVVVTRYFWWIQLQSDRFNHVINATKIILDTF
jgi:putative IMPACT (imprinted ancient) family translation regulator